MTIIDVHLVRQGKDVDQRKRTKTTIIIDSVISTAISVKAILMKTSGTTITLPMPINIYSAGPLYRLSRPAAKRRWACYGVDGKAKLTRKHFTPYYPLGVIAEQQHKEGSKNLYTCSNNMHCKRARTRIFSPARMHNKLPTSLSVRSS